MAEGETGRNLSKVTFMHAMSIAFYNQQCFQGANARSIAVKPTL